MEGTSQKRTGPQRGYAVVGITSAPTFLAMHCPLAREARDILDASKCDVLFREFGIVLMCCLIG